MQFVSNGPDVPEMLIKKHAEGNVVFFCGAGISIPNGLPTFQELVNKILDRTGNFPVNKEEELEDELDQRLNRLDQISPKDFRPLLLELLKVKPTPDLKTHEALVKLSIRPEDESIALVTTNFDHLFEFACHKLNLQHKYFSAPALPIPKKSKWDGIVYLHGLLPKQENVKELKSLVLTSGDFGLAYLTERWAARFITDLFRNYSVCFVGYSLNDTVMRYIADAIAADRALGEALPNMWAFVPYSETQLEKEKIGENWKIRGIEPILYSTEDDHRALHETLQMWANIYADGPESKEHLVTTHANLDPLKSTKEDDFVARVLWALADKSGNPAKVFASLEPKPSLEWLKIFSESSEKNSEDDSQVLFSTNPSITQNCSVFVFPEKDADWDAPHIHIISWVLKYLNDERLLLWLLQKGRHLRPFFKQQIR